MKTNQNEECPLCMEKLEVDDLNFFPCSCKYQVCRFCWNHIITSENGLCPACRRPYNSEEPASFKPLSKDEIKQIRRKQKPKTPQNEDWRKDLVDKRVLQPNLLFVVNLPLTVTKDENLLKSHEYFGKYGLVLKIVLSPLVNGSISSNTNSMTSINSNSYVSAYVTYRDRRSALIAILDITKYGLAGFRSIKASLGTTKYCSQFLKGGTCVKKECMYLHQRGDDKASFTKEDMTAGKHSQYEENLILEFLRSLDPSTLPEGHFLAPKPAPKPLLECEDVTSIDATSMLAKLGVGSSSLSEQSLSYVDGNSADRRTSRDHVSPARQSSSKSSSSGKSKVSSKQPVNTNSIAFPRVPISTHSDSLVKSSLVYKHLSTRTQSPIMTYNNSSLSPQQHHSQPLSQYQMSSHQNRDCNSPDINSSSFIEQAVICSNSDQLDYSIINIENNSSMHDIAFSSMNLSENMSTIEKSASSSAPLCRRQSEDDSWLVDMVSDNLSHLNQMALEEQNQMNSSHFETRATCVDGTTYYSPILSKTSVCAPPPGFEESIPMTTCSITNPYVSNVLDRSSSYRSQSSGSLASLVDSNTGAGYYSGAHHEPLLSSQSYHHSQPTLTENSDSVSMNQYDPKQLSYYSSYNDPQAMVPYSTSMYSAPQTSVGLYYPQESASASSNGFSVSPPLASNQDHNSYATFTNPNDLMELLKTILPVDATLRFASVFPLHNSSPAQQPEQNVPMNFISERGSGSVSSNSLDRSYGNPWPASSQPQYFPVSSSSEQFYLNQHMLLSQSLYMHNKCAPVYPGSMMEHEKGTFINDGMYATPTVILREPLYPVGRADFT